MEKSNLLLILPEIVVRDWLSDQKVQFYCLILIILSTDLHTWDLQNFFVLEKAPKFCLGYVFFTENLSPLLVRGLIKTGTPWLLGRQHDK